MDFSLVLKIARETSEVLAGQRSTCRIDRHFTFVAGCGFVRNRYCKADCVNFTAVFDVKTPK